DALRTLRAGGAGIADRASCALRTLWPESSGVAFRARQALRAESSWVAFRACNALWPDCAGACEDGPSGGRRRSSRARLHGEIRRAGERDRVVDVVDRGGAPVTAPGHAARTLRSGRALLSRWSRQPLRTGVAFGAGWSLRTRVAFDARWSLRTKVAFGTRRSLRTKVPFGAHRSGNAWRTGRAGKTGRTRCTRRTWIARRSGRTLNALCARIAFYAGRALWTRGSCTCQHAPSCNGRWSSHVRLQGDVRG